MRMLFRLPLLVFVLVVFAASQLAAQPAQNRRIRGTVESLDGNALVVKARDGAIVKITLADNYAVTGYNKRALSDIRRAITSASPARRRRMAASAPSQLISFPKALAASATVIVHGTCRTVR